MLKIESLSSLWAKTGSRSLQLQNRNGRVYAPRDTRKRSIVAERLLRCRPMFRKSLMASVAVSKPFCSPLLFVEPGVEVDGRYYRDVLLKQRTLPVKHRIASDTYVFQQDSDPAHRAHDTVQLPQQETRYIHKYIQSYIHKSFLYSAYKFDRLTYALQSSTHPTCGRQTAQTWTRSTTVSGVSCRNEFTRLQCMTQLTSSSASLRLGRAFHRLSSTKSLTSGLPLRACVKAKGRHSENSL